MTKDEFREKYVNYMVRAGVNIIHAEANFDATGPDDYNYDEDDPEICADEEMSYWTDDGD